MNNQSAVYLILNKINGKGYVGQSVNVSIRWKTHKQQLRANKHHNSHLQNSWNKYREENFDFLILEYCHPNFLYIAESYWILFLDTIKNGYNYGFDKNNRRGVKHKLSSRKKMSKKALQRPKSFYDNLSKKFTGRKVNDEQKEKISKKKTTTGIFRVDIKKENIKIQPQGFRFRYCYTVNKKRKELSSVDLYKLEQKVKNKGLKWKIVDEEKAKQTYYLNNKVKEGLP